MFFHMNPSISTLCEMKHEMKWRRSVYVESLLRTSCITKKGLGFCISQFRQHFLTQPVFVFLGTISIPLSLLHGIFIRLPLQWAVIHVLPRLASDAVHRYDVYSGTEAVELRCHSWRCKFATTIIFIVWFSMMLVGCLLWKRYVDTFAICCSRRAEEILMGKQREVMSEAITQNFDEPWLRLRKNKSTNTKAAMGKDQWTDSINQEDSSTIIFTPNCGYCSVSSRELKKTLTVY